MKIIKETELRLTSSAKVKIQHLADDPCEWCIQYRGQGHYYHGFEAVKAYISARWGWCALTEEECR